MIAMAMCVHPTHGVQSASMCVSYMVERERHLYRRHCTWLLCCTYAVLCRAWELWSSTLPVVAQTGACDGARVPNTILSTHVVLSYQGTLPGIADCMCISACCRLVCKGLHSIHMLLCVVIWLRVDARALRLTVLTHCWCHAASMAVCCLMHAD